MARPLKKPRTIRATDDDWDGANKVAEDAGESLQDALRAFLAWYRRKPGARMPTRPPAPPSS